MAIGLTDQPTLEPVPGVRLASVTAGIKKPDGRDPDLVLMELAAGTRVAAVLTRNRFCAAPVALVRSNMASAASRYLLINSGNANAGTGAAGARAARECCDAVAAATDVPAAAVLPFSTGVIGEPLPVSRITAAVPGAVQGLDPAGWLAAARAIGTTDTVPKGATRRVALSGGTVTLTGIAKGAGMIRPDMATMLAFMATDADIPQELLDSLLTDAVNRSFNRITVDGDTSTNDACTLAATGAGGVAVEPGSRDATVFAQALLALCQELACAIVRDGEGATRFIAIQVSGAVDESEAEAVAFTIAHSPLVKTAFFAGDPNWGRILAAVGRAGVTDLDVERVTLWLDDLRIAADGGRAPEYSEAEAAARMAQSEVTVAVELDRGEAAATVWTCDFSYEYVRINAEYRT